MKVYAPWEWVANDWRITEFGNDANSKVAALPVMFNEPHMFCYREDLSGIDLSKFDLVILSDMEYYSIATIQSWIQRNNIKNYVLSLGGKLASENLDSSRMVYRPWWCYNLINHNTYQSTYQNYKPFMFDALLGGRRPHRDYVMLGLQHHNLLQSSIATYRDIFTGGFINHQTEEFSKIFNNQSVLYPYVSDNLNPDWEVSKQLSNSISYIVPREIYQRTWYSIVTETIGTGDCFFLSEKTTKALFAHRVFVLFGNANFLQELRNLGFETFGSVIDESYDCSFLDFQRFHMALEQVVYLNQQDPVKVYKKLQPVLEHNYHRLFELQRQTRKQQQQLLRQQIPLGYIIN